MRPAEALAAVVGAFAPNTPQGGHRPLSCADHNVTYAHRVDNPGARGHAVEGLGLRRGMARNGMLLDAGAPIQRWRAPRRAVQCCAEAAQR
jgi:hypothetical protein